MSENIEERLDRLESLVEDQQQTIQEQRDRIAELEADETGHGSESDQSDGDDTTPEPAVLNRRSALKAGGLLALLFGGVSTASADPQGQVGTSSDPLTALHTEELNGGVTGDQALTDLTGAGLSVNSETLDSAWQESEADGLLEPNGSETGIDVTDVQTDSINGGVTGDTDLTDLVGTGLTVDGGTLSLSTDPTETQFTGTDTESGDQFGYSVAVSGDKSTIVVGAPEEDSGGTGAGKAYVFDGSGTQTASLTASDATSYDKFGNSVAVNRDGSTIVVGAPYDDNGGAGADGAYIFDGSGNETARLTASGVESDVDFGSSVAVSPNGSTVVVGAPTDDSAATDAGKAFVFDNSGTEMATLTASDAESDDQFGSSVAVDGSTIVVGAPEEDSGGTDAGKAYVFDASGTQTGTLTADDAESYDGFGYSVAVSSDGSTIVVGARLEDSGGTKAGKAYVFDASGTQTASLIASDAESGDQFGSSVATAGSTIVVGAPGEDSGGSYAGKAYVFDSDGAQTDTLTASDAESDDDFGSSVAVSADGRTSVVGAFDESSAGTNAGKAYLYEAGVDFAF